MDKLPEELLGEIIRTLRPSELKRLALVNKGFARITMTLLYTDCKLVHKESYDQLQLIRSLLRTIVKSSDLRALVRHVHIGDWQTGQPEATDENVAKITKADLGAFIACIPHYPSWTSDYQRKFECGLRNSSQDAMAATILSLIPNVESLTLETYHYEYNDHEDLMMFAPLDFNKTLTFELIELASIPSQTALLKSLTSIKINGKIYPDETVG